MRIEELHLKNFRCFKELDIQFPKSNLAVFIGLNGAGKSAILDAIAIFSSSLYLAGNTNDKGEVHHLLAFEEDDICIGEKETINKVVLNHCNEKLSFEIINQHTQSILKIDTQDKKLFNSCLYKASDVGDINNSLFMFSYYKASRDKRNKFYSINDFSTFEEWFEKEENIENQLKLDKKDFESNNPKLHFIRKSINHFFSNISGASFSNLKVDRKHNTINSNSKYKFDLMVNKDKKTLKVSQLSDGEKKILLMVSDIASDLTDVNPSYSNYQNSDDYYFNMLKINGIVLIDEIEFHLHPQWQREVLPALQKTFPNIQFIVTTHSPQVLSRVHKDDIFILKDNQLYQPSSNPIGRDSSDILNEIMDVTNRPEDIQKLADNYFLLINKNQFEEAQKIREQLLELVKAKNLDKDDPIFIRADAILTRKRLLGK